MAETWGIILAAGESSRMKKPKLLLPFKESTIFECALDNIMSSKVDKVMVVLGGAKDQVKSLIGIRPVLLCINEHFREGMLSSVKCGVRALPENAEAILVYLADQPLISPSVTNLLLKAWRKEKAGLVVPSFNGKRGHPLLIDMKYRPEIETLDPGKGLRELLQRYPDDLFEVEVSGSSILEDIDTPDDYIQLTINSK